MSTAWKLHLYSCKYIVQADWRKWAQSHSFDISIRRFRDGYRRNPDVRDLLICKVEIISGRERLRSNGILLFKQSIYSLLHTNTMRIAARIQYLAFPIICSHRMQLFPWFTKRVPPITVWHRRFVFLKKYSRRRMARLVDLDSSSNHGWWSLSRTVNFVIGGSLS